MSEAELPTAWRELVREAPSPAWAANGLARLMEAGVDPGALDRTTLGPLSKVLGSSPVLSQWLVHDPALIEVLDGSDLDRELGPDEYISRLAGPDGGWEEQEVFFRRLRSVHKREMLRVVARETLGLAPVDVTAREISAFAEAAVDAALVWAEAALVARHGAPVGEDGLLNRGCVLGMGKLGSRELNLSSDVDLIFLYRTSGGSTTGGDGGKLDPREFFSKLVSLVAEALGGVTESGLVFRVDLDLRPEGRSGELAQPLDNAVLYYQSWGQTWERAVLMKARPVAGELALGWKFLEEVEPFTFRRSLDYTTVEDIKEMKHRIDRSAARRLGGDVDIKLGRGGIREVEFFVQTLQLIHGGKTPEVRERSTFGALGRLVEAGVVEEEVALGLTRCYRFLRRLEHAIQALHFRQTHRLPASPEELTAVARRLGFGKNGEAALELLGALDDVRSEVHAAYGRLVHGASRTWEDQGPGAEKARDLLAIEPDAPGAEQALIEAGFGNPARASEGLRLLREGPPRARPSTRARRILDRIAPFLLDAVRRSPDPDRALLHMGEFLAASGARASYLSLLEENPPTAKLLVTLFGTSGFLSRYLVGHPELLDELVLGSQAVREKSRSQMGEELAAATSRCRDEEERLETLRRFRNAEFLRIALNDLWGAIDSDVACRQITRVAEVCLDEACSQSLARLEEKYGTPREEEGAPARFAVLGLGKLGGGEIDYHSDLDVLFLYSGRGTSRRSDGSPGLSNGEFFARLAQRIMGVLTTRTREGIAFRMDARLRPSGQAGPLVSSLEAFETYHREGSHTWERQALVRLRPVAGDEDLGQAVLEGARRVLYGAPPTTDPKPEILRMRERIEREVGREAAGRADLKAGFGGIVDVEFAVQALQLLHGWQSDDLQSPNTLEALSALRRYGLLGETDGTALEEGYQFLRRVEGRLRILSERPTDTLPRDPARLGELVRGLGYEAGEGNAALLADLKKHKGRIRESYARILQGGQT